MVFAGTHIRFLTITTTRGSLDRTWYHTHEGPDAVMRGILHALSALAHQPAKACYNRTAHHLNHALTELCHARLTNEPRGEPKHGRARRRYDAVLEYVREHHHQPITRDSIASFFGLNSSYVSQLFNRFGRESLSSTLLRARMERATRLLTGSEAKIAHVALDSGYADVRTFHKAFRRYYNTTPAAYRLQAFQKAATRK